MRRVSFVLALGIGAASALAGSPGASASTRADERHSSPTSTDGSTWCDDAIVTFGARPLASAGHRPRFLIRLPE